jgi:hypothetical protein
MNRDEKQSRTKRIADGLVVSPEKQRVAKVGVAFSPPFDVEMAIWGR